MIEQDLKEIEGYYNRMGGFDFKNVPLLIAEIRDLKRKLKLAEEEADYQRSKCNDLHNPHPNW